MNFPRRSQGSRAPVLAGFVALLCAVHVWMASSVSDVFSTTSDEIAHLTAGYSYWTLQDFRLQPENGNFPQRWAALPLLWQDLRYPASANIAGEGADVWSIGHIFFHESGNDRAGMLASARLMNALLSGLLCLSIFLFARALFDATAGLVALLLAVFSPTLLAHGGLVTSDTAAALGFVLATFTWWRVLHRMTPASLVLAGCSLGLLALSKYSVVLFAPMAVLMAVARLVRSAPVRVKWVGTHRWNFHRLGARIAAIVAAGVVTVLLAWTLVWAGYGFRFEAASEPGGQFAQSWDVVLFKVPPNPSLTMADGRTLEVTDPTPGPVQHAVEWARAHRLLPEAWLYGLAFVEKHSRGRMAFFAGEYRMTGWRSFFPTAFLLKTPLAALTLMAVGLLPLVMVRRRRRAVWFYRILPLATVLGVYWAFSIQSHLNIGHRHLLPIYAASFTLAAAGALLVKRGRAWAVVLVLLLAWHTRESLAIRPDYLAYFNSFAGGPEEAHQMFVDSSLDWGQDLPRLREWLALHTADEPVFLSYFGTGSPAHEGIDAVRIGDAYFDSAPVRQVPELTGGIYAISATMLRRVYTHVRGPWSSSYEAAYQRLGRWREHDRRQAVGASPTDVDGSPLPAADVSMRFFLYEQLQFGRLCHYLEHRAPDARIGYSILIFRLSDAEVKFALTAPLPEIDAIIAGLSPP